MRYSNLNHQLLLGEHNDSREKVNNALVKKLKTALAVAEKLKSFGPDNPSARPTAQKCADILLHIHDHTELTIILANTKKGDEIRKVYSGTY